MKILYVITKANWGGAQRYVYDLANACADDKHEVVVAYGERGVLTERLEDIGAATGIRTEMLPSLRNSLDLIHSFRGFRETLALLRKEKPDVLHVNSSVASVLGVIAGKICGVKRIVFTLHGWPLAGVVSPKKERLFALPIYLTILLSHTTIAVSSAVRNAAPRFIRRKMIAIPNGITCTPNLTREQARKVLTTVHPILANLPKDAVWIGTIAELHPVKGIRYAIEAIHTIKQTTPVMYMVLGEGSERIALETLISKHDLVKDVLLPGFVPNAASLLPAFDIVLHPSLSEALAFAVLEAGCAECPVIATSVGGIPEIIEDGKNGLLVPSKNDRVIAHALKKLIDDATLRNQLGAALIKTVMKNFSSKDMIESTKEVYVN